MPFSAIVTLLVYREGRHDRCDASKEMPVMRDFPRKSMLSLRLAAACSALPGVPVAKQFELLVEAGFLDQNVEFVAREALA